MYCPNCGNLLEDDSRFCNKCGAKIILEKEAKGINEEKDRLSILLIAFLFVIIIAIGIIVGHKSDKALGGNRTAQSGKETPSAEDLERQNKEIQEGILIEENSETEKITSEEEKVKNQENEDIDSDEYIYMRDRLNKMSEEEALKLGKNQLYKLDAVAGALEALSYYQYTSYEDKSYEELGGLYLDILFYYYEQCSKNEDVLPIEVPQIEYYDERDPREYSTYGYYKAEQFAYDWIIREVFSLIINPDEPVDEEGNFWYRDNGNIYCMVNGLGVSYVESVSTEIVGYDNGWYDIMMTIDGGYTYVHLVATLNELEQCPEEYYWQFIKIHKVDKVTQ